MSRRGYWIPALVRRVKPGSLGRNDDRPLLERPQIVHDYRTRFAKRRKFSYLWVVQPCQRAGEKRDVGNFAQRNVQDHVRGGGGGRPPRSDRRDSRNSPPKVSRSEIRLSARVPPHVGEPLQRRLEAPSPEDDEAPQEEIARPVARRKQWGHLAPTAKRTSVLRRVPALDTARY